jgi:hypothetical protein
MHPPCLSTSTTTTPLTDRKRHRRWQPKYRKSDGGKRKAKAKAPSVQRLNGVKRIRRPAKGCDEEAAPPDDDDDDDDEAEAEVSAHPLLSRDAAAPFPSAS